MAYSYISYRFAMTFEELVDQLKPDDLLTKANNSRPPLTIAFNPAWMAALVPSPSEPSKTSKANMPLLLPAPKPSPLDRMKRDRRYPRNYEFLLFNTPRLPTGFVKNILTEIFHEEAERAHLRALFERHITAGPHSKDVVKTLIARVRDLAVAEEQPIPCMHCRPV